MDMPQVEAPVSICYCYPDGNWLTSFPDYSAHEQHPSSYSQYDQPRAETYNNYNATPPQTGYGSQATSYYSAAATTPGNGPERSYTLGGDGYGMNAVPPLPERQASVPPIPDHPAISSSYNIPYAGTNTPPINTNVSPGSANTSPVKGPRPQPGMHNAPSLAEHEDSPPGYDVGTSGITGAWGKS